MSCSQCKYFRPGAVKRETIRDDTLDAKKTRVTYGLSTCALTGKTVRGSSAPCTSFRLADEGRAWKPMGESHKDDDFPRVS